MAEATAEAPVTRWVDHRPTGLVRHLGGVGQRGKLASYLRRVLNVLTALSLVICIAFSAFDARALDTSFFSLASALATNVIFCCQR